MSESSETRVNYTVNVRPDTKKVLDQNKIETGIPHAQAAARLLDWFASQPAAVRRAIVLQEDAAEEIWRIRQGEKLARGEGTMGIKDIPAAAQQIRELVDRIEIFDRARRPRSK